MHNDVKEILFSEQDIHDMSVKLGKQIDEDYKDCDSLILLGLLKGSVPFLAELMKRISVPVTMDFMQAKSYVGSTSGELTIKKDIDQDVKGQHILIVEDILDTGKTLSTVKQKLIERGAASVKVATMLDKKEGRIIPFEADYIGFECPNEFIVGFGLDYNEHYRELPYIGVLKEEVYKK